MRVLLCAHGYPPELVGGTELATRATARALARRGNDVLVVAGSIERGDGFRTSESIDVDPESGTAVEVRRLHRGDLYFDHWQKHASPAVERALRELVREWSPDVVHVQHWLRLSSGLVLAAAREGVPAVVSLHDATTTCLLSFRVHPVDRLACDRPYAAFGCVACAENVPPRTPWLPLEQKLIAFAERDAALRRELALARAVLVPSEFQRERIVRLLGDDSPVPEVHPPLRPTALGRRDPIDPPRVLGRLVLGSWGHTSPVKGHALLSLACEREELGFPVELRVAGGEGGRYEPEDLARHDVTAVHALVCGSLAPETHGFVLDEALQLGLPAVLPRAGAFPERIADGDGVLFYEPGDPKSLVDRLRRLWDDPGLVGALRARLPEPSRLLVSENEAIESLLAAYARASAAGPPTGELEPEEWFAERMIESSSLEWDAALARTPATELGLGSPEGSA